MRFIKKIILPAVAMVLVASILGAAAFAADYDDVDARRLSIDLSEYKNKRVKFEDVFWKVRKKGPLREAYLPQLKKYIILGTVEMGGCLVEVKEEELCDTVCVLRRGDRILIYARVKSWNPGTGSRYDIFVEKIELLSEGARERRPK